MTSPTVDVAHVAARLIAEGRAAGRSGLQDVAAMIARSYNCACVIYLKSALRGAVVPMAAAAEQPELAAYMSEFVGRESGWPSETLLEAFRRGETLERTGAPAALADWIGPPAGAHTLHFGLHSLFAAPIRRAGAARIAGVVAVGRHAGEPPLTDADRAAVLALVDALTDTIVREREAWEMHERLEASVRAGRLELLSDGRLATAFRYSSAGIAVFTLDGSARVVDLNERVAEVLGAPPHVLLTRAGIDDYVHAEDVDVAKRALGRLLTGEVEFSRLRVRLLTAAGAPVACEVVLSLSPDANGVTRYGLCQLVDVEEPRRAHHPLAREVRAQEMLAALGRLGLEGTPDAHLMRTTAAGIGSALAVDAAWVVERRADGTTAVVAAHGSVPMAMPVADELPGSARLLDGGLLPGVWRGAGVRSAIVAPLGLGPGPRRWLAAASYEQRSFTAGEERVVEAAAHLVSAATGAGAAPRAEQPPELAGLPGRAQFADRVTHAIARAGRQGESVAVLTLDVDGFRDLNDTLGYEVGDGLLAALVRRLEGVLRAGDTLARLGGDEFGIVCEDISGERGTIEIVRRVIGAFEEPVVVDEHVLHPPVSIGVALGDWVSSSADSLMRDAETALQRAQDQPGTTYELFDRTMRRRVAERIRLEHDLRRALARDELVLHYQPLVSLHERRIVGVEALVRWQHPERGLVAPTEFIAAAESSGLILGVGRWVVREACRQLVAWDAAGLPPVFVSVNVSGRQIAAPGLAEEIGDTLRGTGLEPDRLALELTETVLMEDTGSPLALLQRLKALGVRLLLDDFGTGYSSLNYVKRFPLDGLKVDRSFIAGIADAESDRHILRAIVSMATALDVAVIAEGVETSEQAAWIASMDCDTIQGFGVARPMPAAEIERLLRDGLPPERVSWSLEPPTTGIDEPTVALGEAADVLGISASTIRRWADTGRISAVRTPGGHRRFPVGELRRLKAGPQWRPRTVLRELTAPPGALPEVAAVLRMSPEQMGSVAAGIYEAGRSGWFTRESGVAELTEWAARVATACAVADWEATTDATRRLDARAELGGATLLERFLVLERFGALVAELLERRDVDRAEVAGARRLFARLARGLLAQP